jgi:hypothetical protein
MEFILSFLLKLIIIFLGGGLVSLFAFWVAKESNFASRLLYGILSGTPDIKILKKKKIILKSAIYELLMPAGEKLKLFSSRKGIKIF